MTIQEMPFYWISGLLVLWSGVITAGNVTAAPGISTTTSNEISAFIISIKITNRIYNNSLEDHQSENYKTLRQDVENVFLETYSFTPSAQYQEIAEMTFSNGSVIANSIVLFKTKQKSGQAVKNIFVSNYQQHPSLMLDLNISHTADQDPIPVPLSLLSNISPTISSMAASITITTSDPTTELFNNIQAVNENSTAPTNPTSASSEPDKSTGNNSITITTVPHSDSSTNASDVIHFTTQPTTNSSSTALISSTITSITSASTPSTLTMHSSNKLTNSSDSSLTTTEHPNSNNSSTSASSSSTSAEQPNSNISATSASSSSSSAVHPSSNISAISTPKSSISPGQNITQKPTGPEGSNTVATEQGVPGWGIAILVLAAIILFCMLVLFILLLLCWCCWWRQRGFMHVSDPDPTGYYNPDIPMYSTHSTYDSHNGKSLDSVSETHPKTWAGMYTINK